MTTSCSRPQSLRFLLTLALAFSLAAGSWPRPQRAADAPAKVQTLPSAEIEERAKETYGKLGVSFEENRGQVDKRVRFLSRGGGSTVFLTNDEAAFVLSASEASDKASGGRPLWQEGLPEALARRGPERRKTPKLSAVHMKFEGADPRAEVSGERELAGKVNYFRGSDPSKWQTNVRTYGAVRYRGIYDGIDLVYYGNESGQMEYDFVVAPGADARQISLKIEGAKALEVDASGDLVMSTPAGEMRQPKPTVYQELAGARREVEGGYALEAGGRMSFALGEYDPSAPLIIDPALAYSTYLGGSEDDFSNEIAVDSAGNAYVVGGTYSADFPTADAIRGEDGGLTEAFVTKLNADGAIVYSTFLGGSGDEGAGAVAVDSAGDIYVTGSTNSTDFPTVNPVQGTNASSQEYADVFITKLDAAGTAIIYSTYLGGGGFDFGQGIAVDSAGGAYVTGLTQSPNFPIVNPVQGTGGGSYDAFVTKLNSAGSAIVYSTYLGSTQEDEARGIAVDSAGNACITGLTFSPNFPVVNPLQPYGRNTDAFVAKFNAAGTALIYSTFLGGSVDEVGQGIAVDSAGNAYVTGYTGSSNFPLVNPILSSGDGFVTKLNTAGTALVYSTYIRGPGKAIAVDSAGEAWVTGYTVSPHFQTVNPVQDAFGGGPVDAFVTKLNAVGTALIYSTYLGGSDWDWGQGIAVDSAGNAYVTGSTLSPDFPTANPVQGTPGGKYDVFATKFSFVSINGRVITKGAAGVVGVPWVTIKVTGIDTLTKLTDAHGYYSFTSLPRGGDYTVTPTKNNLSFAPASRTFADLDSSLSDLNFTVPSLSVNDIAVTEGDAGEVTAIFTVRLTPASDKPVTVNCQTIGGATNPAADGADYTALPVTLLTFSPGQTAKAVSVTVKGDALDEANETLRLRLSEATNALLSDNIGVGTITDNDPAPALSVNSVSVTERDADVTATFTVTLLAASGRTVKVMYRTANGTATAPSDYAALALTTLIFAPGETTKTVTVTVKGDALDEPAETFKLLLSSPANAGIAVGAGTCTITDDD